MAASRRAFWRFWFPCFVVALTAVAEAGIWLWRDEQYVDASRNSATFAIALLTLIVLVAWSLFVFRYRVATLITVVAMIAIGWGVVRKVKFTGNMLPRILFRWSASQDEIVEAHRRTQHTEGLAAVVTRINETDFPEYRGVERDGIVHGPALVRDWKASPPRKRWRQPCGGGYAAFAVAGNLAVTIEQRRDNEVVVAYDTATGVERWKYENPTHFSETLGGDGPRATPTIKDGAVYALGANGHLACLDAATGQRRWSIEILSGNENVRWGMSGSPLVYDKVIVVNAGAQNAATSGQALVALDRESGKRVWQAGNTPAGYSSPMLATLAGQRQILLFDGQGIAGFDAEKGAELWRFPWDTMNGINVAQPVVLDGDRVFISSAYNVGCAMLHVTHANDQWKVEPLWKNKQMRCKFTSPVSYRGYLYGLDEGILACMEEETGKRKWRDGRYGHGQILLSGDTLLVLGESGKLALVQATPDGFHEFGSIAALEGKTWNYPTLADGKAYLRNEEEMACYDLTGTEKN